VFDTFPRLADRRTQRAGSLSGGEQQMLAIGRALMSAPRLLLIDELSLGLSPIVVDALLERLGSLNQTGLSLVLIEQFVHRALAVADRVYLLAKGRVQFSGTPQEVADAGAVEIAYLSGGL
jgi:branched-chain amino acid transport system ATP-binding protein